MNTKTTISILVALTGLLVSGISYTQSIVGTAHDMSGEVWNTNNELCGVCHGPHNAIEPTAGPLWDHTLTVQTFTPYDSATMTAAPGTPGPISILCLSCHDGTVALDSFGGNTGSTMMTGPALFGTDLTDSHPIGITYDDALAAADGGLFPPTSTLSGLGSTIDVDMLFGAANNLLECASCHDVHTNEFAPFLITSNTNSALCLTCHDK